MTNKESLEQDIVFYKDLGFTDVQSKYLATHVLNKLYNMEGMLVYNGHEAPQGFEAIPKRAGFRGLSMNNLGGQQVGAQAFPDANFLRASSSSEVPFGAPFGQSEDFGVCEDSFDCCDTSFDEGFAEDDCEDEFTPEELGCAKLSSIGNPFIDTLESNKYLGSRYNRNEDVSGFRDTSSSPTSTFKSTVNTASFTYVRNKLLNEGIIDKDVVRVEEIINYFDYNIDNKIQVEMCSKNKHNYMLVGIKGDKVEPAKQNLVILLDTSGSMEGNESTMQKSILTMVKQLGPDDTVSLITYSSTDKTVFEGFKASNISDIILSLCDINIDGLTDGSNGLDMAYKLSEKYFVKDGSNRVVIITDGDFNFGIHDQNGLRGFIKDKKESGSFLTVIGVGSVQDEQTMETLARNGNGNYFRLYDDFDIIEVLKRKFNANTVVAAKDVKIQVEFNPGTVQQYRLIGYETRALKHEDFNNDKVESETIGSEHVVVALYELILNNTSTVKNIFKYQKVSLTDSDDICTVSLRYKLPNEDESKLEQSVVKPQFNETPTQNMRIAIAAKVLGDNVRGTDFAEKGDIKEALKLIKDIQDSKVDMLRNLLSAVK